MSSKIGSLVNNTIMGVITGVIFLLIGIALGPIVVSSAADINATSLSGVYLSSVIILLAQFLPMFYYLGIVLGATLMIWASTKAGKK